MPRVAHGLLDLIDASEARGAPIVRACRGDMPSRHELLDVRLDVEAQFVVEVMLDRRASEQRAQAELHRVKDSHGVTPCEHDEIDGRRKPLPALELARECVRPARVSE